MPVIRHLHSFSCFRLIPTTAFGCRSLEERRTSFRTTPTECGWIRNAQVSFLASVPSTVEHSTLKCCYAFRWMDRRILPAGFEPSRDQQSKTQAQSQVGECLKAMPASTAMQWPEPPQMDALALT